MITTKPNIFIVDDNAAFRKLIKNFLNSKGYNVIGEASDGEEFLSVFSDLDVNIVLMDINMPKLNGIETTKIINQKYSRDIKIIALSQHDEFEYLKSMIEAGAMAYVTKTELAEHLLPAIENVIKGSIYYPNLQN